MNLTKDKELLREQTRLTKAKADLTELKLKVQQGELIYIKDVKKQWSEAASRIRGKLLALPETAPQLYGLEIKDIKGLIDLKVKEILNELAEEYR